MSFAVPAANYRPVTVERASKFPVWSVNRVTGIGLGQVRLTIGPCPFSYLEDSFRGR